MTVVWLDKFQIFISTRFEFYKRISSNKKQNMSTSDYEQIKQNEEKRNNHKRKNQIQVTMRKKFIKNILNGRRGVHHGRAR